ncbi:MAG TPA: hypothetical protein VK196_16095, partial [Magnetospirillum sp.]|nr:hypothetical protein [Magnetospirillum sp.]
MARRHADIQVMDLEDSPLLHFPDLVLAVLLAGRDGPASVADAARLLARHRAQAREASGVDAAELAEHLDRACRHLHAAHAIELLEGRRYRATPRGRLLLRAHPSGVDDGVLMEYPEFRAWIERNEAGKPPEDPRPREFIDGWISGQHGGELGDNPICASS